MKTHCFLLMLIVAVAAGCSQKPDPRLEKIELLELRTAALEAELKAWVKLSQMEFDVVNGTPGQISNLIRMVRYSSTNMEPMISTVRDIGFSVSLQCGHKTNIFWPYK